MGADAVARCAFGAPAPTPPAPRDTPVARVSRVRSRGRRSRTDAAGGDHRAGKILALRIPRHDLAIADALAERGELADLAARPPRVDVSHPVRPTLARS